MWVNGGRQISVREQMIHKAETYRMIELSEGQIYLTLQLTAGEACCESSFGVENTIQVEVGVVHRHCRTSGSWMALFSTSCGL